MHKDKNILLFDGVCNLCNYSVNTIIFLDKKQSFYFTSLQSETGKQLLEAYQVPKSLDSVVLISQGKVYYKSQAALKVMYLLGGFWKIFVILKFFPLSLRDRLYDFLAKNRYRIFGKKQSCRVPTPELISRFL